MTLPDEYDSVLYHEPFAKNGSLVTHPFVLKTSKETRRFKTKTDAKPVLVSLDHHLITSHDSGPSYYRHLSNLNSDRREDILSDRNKVNRNQKKS